MILITSGNQNICPNVGSNARIEQIMAKYFREDKIQDYNLKRYIYILHMISERSQKEVKAAIEKSIEMESERAHIIKFSLLMIVIVIALKHTIF